MTAKELRYQRNRHRQQFTRYEQALIKFSQAESLSKEEREVLILGAMHPNLKHLTNREISLRLGLSLIHISEPTRPY